MSFIDARESSLPATIETDLCIVGAGAAGITLASELQSSGIDVCLLESGGFTPDEETQSLYDLTSTGYPVRPNFMSRARYFGGSCNLWAGRNMRMSPIDFEVRGWVPNSGWPLSYQELSPFYDRAEQILGVPSHLRFASVGATSGLVDRERALFEAGDLQPAVALWGTKPMRFARVFGPALRRSRNLEVYLNANVTEIVPTEDGGRIDSVSVRTLGGRSYSARASIYVLASGGLENARLLLVSRRRHQEGVANDHDVVGRYFLEHPRALFGSIAVNGGVRIPYLSGIPLPDGKVQFGVALSERSQREACLLNAYVSLEPAMSASAAKNYGRSMTVAKMFVLRGYQHSGVVARTGRANVRELIYMLTPKEVMPHWMYRSYAFLKRHARSRLSGGHLTVVNYCEQVPDPASRVTLSSEKDAFGMEKLRLDWRIGDAERRTIVQLHELLARRVEQVALGRMELRARDGTEMQFTDASHHMGTTRMHDDPRRGVVDRNCRVHRQSNLFVAGSSVFATGGHANPTLTIVALALRLSDHVKDQVRSLR